MAEDDLTARVRSALEHIRPRLQADGGDIEFVAIEDGTVKVRLQGACAGCPFAQVTLRRGVEAYLKDVVPEVVGVEQADE